MRTLTEFSGVVARRALEVRAAKAAEGLEGEALAEAIGADVGVSGDRLARLVELVELAGDKLGNVRLVRVFQGETAPSGAMSAGEFHYVLDRMAAPPRPDRGDDRRGGRDGGRRDRPGGRGGPGGPGGGGRGPGGPRGREGFGADRGERVNPREVPVAGAGWMMTRAPRDPDEDRRGPRGRGPRRDRPPGDRRDRGPGGDRRGPPRRSGPPRPPQEGAPAGAPPPGAHLGPKAEVRVGDAPGGDPRNRRRRGRGRGPRPEGSGAPHPRPEGAPVVAETAPPTEAPAPPSEPPPADEGAKESEG